MYKLFAQQRLKLCLFEFAERTNENRNTVQMKTDTKYILATIATRTLPLALSLSLPPISTIHLFISIETQRIRQPKKKESTKQRVKERGRGEKNYLNAKRIEVDENSEENRKPFDISIYIYTHTKTFWLILIRLIIKINSPIYWCVWKSNCMKYFSSSLCSCV